MVYLYERGETQVGITGEDKDLERYLVKYGYTLVTTISDEDLAEMDKVAEQSLSADETIIVEPIVEAPAPEKKKAVKKKSSKV